MSCKQGSTCFGLIRCRSAERAKAYAELKQGAVKMSKLDTRDNGAEIPVPDGMIHHWVGLAFIPGAHVDDVLGDS